MSEGKSIHEIHLGFVELLKARGEQVVQPRGKPMGSIYGYDKTIGLISAGSIFKEKDGSFSLLQDMCQYGYTGVKLEDIGLCDAKCWYEATEDKRIKDANKKQADKLADLRKGAEEFCKDNEEWNNQHQYRFNTSQEDAQRVAKPGAALAELCINIGEGQAVVSPEGKIEFHDTGLNISLRDLQFVVQEAEAYLKYRKTRIG